MYLTLRVWLWSVRVFDAEETPDPAAISFAIVVVRREREEAFEILHRVLDRVPIERFRSDSP